MPEEVQLTPEQQAQYDQLAGAHPVEINPIRDFDASQLAELAVKDKEGFDLVGEFRRNQDLWADPATVQKTADALNIVKQRGFELSDLPGPKKIVETVLESAKGFGKQLWNYGSAAVGIVQGALTEPFSEDLATGFAAGVTEKLAKNIAGTEEAMSGLSQIPGKIVSKARRVLGPDFTPEQKVADLWKDVGVSEVQQSRVTGQGPFTQTVTGGAAGELNPEEISTLAAGDPFSFAAFSKGFQLAGRAVPEVVRGVLAKTGEKTGEAAAAVGGRTVQTAGKVTELGAKAVQTVAPAAGLVKGAIEAGPVGALAGLKAGEIAASVAKKVSTAGAKVAELGKQVSGAAPITSSLAQAGRDVLEALPGAAGTVSIGLGQDIGLSALTSETPAETQGAIGIGTALGVAGAAGRVGRRVISGQLVAPREYGVNTVTPSSGNFPTLDAIHSESIRAATPGEQTRLNAVRLFAKGAAPGTDIFFARDAAALTQTLTDLGVSPETAAQYAQQEGFFTVNLPDKSGTPRKVIIARNVEAAPHEAFHAVQDVLGEVANRELDNVVRQEYSDQWEAEGQRYATRLVGDLAGRDWRETILDESGWGHAESMEKLSNAISNEVIGQTGASVDPGFVADRVRADWRRIAEEARQRNPQARPEQVWREILSPEEAASVADRYLARELAAENFDIVFKNLGAALDAKQPLVRKLAGVAAKLISTVGGEPLAGRRSEIGQIEPRFRVTEAVTVAAKGKRPAPVVEPRTPRQPVSVPRTPEENQDAAESARQIAAEAPDTAREMLGAVAEAIAQRSGVKINYLSAPGEPAAAATSNRVARREIIEVFRTMPAAARALWEKNFFPERVIRTKNGKYQILGWAPEVFAANAHKLAGWLAEHPNLAVPYAIDATTKTFTPDAWQQLFADTQQFVRNQQAGATGAGETLVVPENIRERGFTAPARTGGESLLSQDRADVINMLFGFKLPETPRIQKGRLPLAIAGEEVSAATKPGRVEVPVRPRGEFAGIEAASQDIAGRPINEVNPFRNAVEAAGNPPSLIEAVQRLNLENIKEVALAPEQPEFRGNTLTLTAGFQPSSHPRAVDKAAVRDEQGRIFTGAYHGDAMEQAKAAGSETDYGDFDSGFVDKQGNWLTRQEAFQRAEEIKQLQLPPPGEQNVIQREMKRQGLESVSFEEYRQFQPKSIKEEMDNLSTRSQEDFKAFTDGYKSEKFGGGLTGWAFDLGASAKTADDVSAFRSTAQTLSTAGREAMKAGEYNRAMELIGRSQAAREAFEAATGRTLDGTQEAAVPFIREHFDPNYNPPVPPVGEVPAPAEGQFQPKRDVDEFISEGRVQFQAGKGERKPLPKKIKAYHLSAADFRLTKSDPAKMRESTDKFWGKEHPKTFFFVEGSEADPGKNFSARSVYQTEINRSDLYDATESDPLGFFGTNREEADYAVREAGYKGVLIPIKDGKQVVIMYSKQPLKYVGETDDAGNLIKSQSDTQFQPPREAEPQKIILGTVEDDGTISGKTISKADSGLTSHADEGIYGGMPWRFLTKDKTVFWWADAPEISPAYKESVEAWLNKKGYTEVAHKFLYTEPYRGEQTNLDSENYFRSHPFNKAKRQFQPAERPFDVIDAIEQNVGGKLSLTSAREFQKDFKPIGAARDLFSITGRYKLDDVLSNLQEQGLFRQIESDEELLDAIIAAAETRKGFREQTRRENKILEAEANLLVSPRQTRTI